MKILLIEDYEPIRTSVTRGLREAGFAVDAAGDGCASGCAKYPHQGSEWRRYPAAYLHEVLGLVRLQGRPRGFPWAKA